MCCNAMQEWLVALQHADPAPAVVVVYCIALQPEHMNCSADGMLRHPVSPTMTGIIFAVCYYI